MGSVHLEAALLPTSIWVLARMYEHAGAAMLASMRSLLVDDSSRFLTAARELLEGQGMEVVGVASTIEEAAQLARSLRPDVCLVDIDLGDESGFDLALRLTESEDESPRVILISAYPERDFADMIPDSPAIGFLGKQALSVERIRALLEG